MISDVACDLVLEVSHRGCREHLAEKERGEPARALPDHGPEADLRVWLIECLDTAELLNVLRLLTNDRIDHVIHRHDAEHVAAFVNHGNGEQVVLRDEPRYLFAPHPVLGQVRG